MFSWSIAGFDGEQDISTTISQIAMIFYLGIHDLQGQIPYIFSRVANFLDFPSPIVEHLNKR